MLLDRIEKGGDLTKPFMLKEAIRNRRTIRILLFKIEVIELAMNYDSQKRLVMLRSIG